MGGLIRNWSNNIFWTIVLAAAPTNLASSHLYQWNRITGNTKVPITQNLKGKNENDKHWTDTGHTWQYFQSHSRGSLLW